MALGGGHGGHGSRRGIQHDRISIQMYSLRDATAKQMLPTVPHRLVQYGYEKVELACYYGLTAAEMRAALEEEGIRASSSHEGTWEVLTSRLDRKLAHLEGDLYRAYTRGVNSGAADPLRFARDVIRTAPQTVRQFHVKDRSATDGDMADLGTGVIDFAKIFGEHQVEEYIVENDTPTSPH